MNIFFLTKDVSWDYVNVKYLPAIPEKINYFFGKELDLSLGHSLQKLNRSEYPSIFVKNDGEHWGIIVTGLDSGRLDRTNCPIAIRIIIYGDNCEYCDFGGLFEKVISESFANNGKSEELTHIFTEVIQKGDPAQLSAQYYKEIILPLPERSSKEEISLENVCKTLLKKIQNLSTEYSSNGNAYTLPFYGGMYDKNSRCCFTALCRNLISGKEKGIALAFNLADEETILDLWEDFNYREDIGILLNFAYDSTVSHKVMQPLRKKKGKNEKNSISGDNHGKYTSLYNSFIDAIIIFLESIKVSRK